MSNSACVPKVTPDFHVRIVHRDMNDEYKMADEIIGKEHVSFNKFPAHLVTLVIHPEELLVRSVHVH